MPQENTYGGIKNKMATYNQFIFKSSYKVYLQYIYKENYLEGLHICILHILETK